MGGLVGAAAMLGGPILMLLALAFVILALPASIMVLAMERSVGAAVNPMNLAVLISRIGTPYFLLYGYLILLTSPPAPPRTSPLITSRSGLPSPWPAS